MSSSHQQLQESSSSPPPQNGGNHGAGDNNINHKKDNNGGEDSGRPSPDNPPMLFGRSGPEKSREGWTVFVTGIHEEAQEDDLVDVFSEFGPVKNVHISMDRKSGLARGYALVQFEIFTDAQDAINALHETEVLGKTVRVDWAFVKSTSSSSRKRRRRG